MEQIRLGTIGTGFIVRSILDNVVLTEGIVPEAAYSRTEQAGSALAQSYGITKVYTDLQAFFADEAINCVYVASPNSLHYRYTKMALLAGKHVICEKPFCPTAAQARELMELAREKGLMLVDATPTAYQPNLEILRQQLPKIGRIRMVMSNYSQYSIRYDALAAGQSPNVFNPEFCGGCLMDINYYNLFVNIALFGKPQQAVYYPNLWENGIDTAGCLVMRYPGFISSNVGTKNTLGENFLQIEGEQGYIRTECCNWLENIRVVTRDTQETFGSPQVPDNYIHEIRGIAAMLLEEDRQQLQARQALILDVMEVLESARLSAGIRFPVDGDAR